MPDLGWRALQPGMEQRLEVGAGPHGQDVLALLYTMSPGGTYAIERELSAGELNGPVELPLWGKATRVLHLAAVIVDERGVEHECALTLVPDDWRDLTMRFPSGPASWAAVRSIRLEDRTGLLGGQGPASVKIAGLPLAAGGS